MLSMLRGRAAKFWEMAQLFIDNRDAHGLHDVGVEIQALERAIAEVEKIDGQAA